MRNQENYKYYAKSADTNEISRGTRIFITVAAFLLKILFRPVYHNLHYIPDKNELGEGYFITANHYSNFDPVLLHITIPDYVYWVSKKELFQNKFLAKLFTSLKMIPLDREHTDINAIKTIISYVKENKIIGIFPQGTKVKKNNYEEILPKAGVASICMRYKSTILPVYCDSPYKIFRKNHFYFGAPYCLNPNFKAENRTEQHQILVNEMLRRSYHIVGLSYFE